EGVMGMMVVWCWWGRDGAAEVMMIWRRMVVDEWLSWMAAAAGRR
ncbi:hypothetical protein Tco_0056997, partial [Tanacetum coccineum]